MPPSLTVRNRQQTRTVNVRWLRRIALDLLARHFQPAAHTLGVFFVDAREMARLNERFLRHAGPTDVITLDYAEPGRSETLCGDIFICVDEALLQARRFRVPWQAELVRYLVHGLLHLRGYDDQTPAALRRMKREENRLLKRMLRAFPAPRPGRQLTTDH